VVFLDAPSHHLLVSRQAAFRPPNKQVLALNVQAPQENATSISVLCFPVISCRFLLVRKAAPRQSCQTSVTGLAFCFFHTKYIALRIRPYMCRPTSSDTGLFVDGNCSTYYRVMVLTAAPGIRNQLNLARLWLVTCHWKQLLLVIDAPHSKT
jgi:hypothetical protein